MVGSSAMSSRRRPKRQRTRTTIYTDDNPTTFTTKKKRNSGGSSSGGGHTDDQNFSPSQGESSVSTPTPRPTPLTASSNTNANTNANFGWQQQEESVSEESESMPPPAPVVKRGPGRPPRNRTATTPGDHSHSHSQSQSQSHHPHHTRASSSSAGINGNVNVNVNVNVNGGANSITPNRNQHHHPDSYASPELPTPITSRSAPMSLSSTSTSTSPGSDLPVVVKRKRGRPPKNRPKQEGGSVSILYSISTSASASTEPSPDRSGSHSLSMDRPEALASAGESEHQHQHHQHQHHTRCNPLGRRSLPETSSSSTELVGTALRNRRSLDSVRSKNAPRFQNSNPNSNSNPKTKRKPPKKKRTSAGGSRRGRANSSTSWTPPQKDSEGTFVGHSVTVAPILPPVLVHDNDIDDNNDHDINYDRAETADNNTSNSSNNNSINSDSNSNSNSNSNNNNRIRQELQSRYPSIFGGTGIPKSSSSLATPFSSASHGHAHPHPYPHPYPYASSGTAKGKSNQSQHGSSRLPAWTPLYDPPVFFDDDYDRETGKLDAANTMPVTRSITALTVRKPDNDYLVLGDSVGFVTIYSLGRDNINLPIAQLESVACQQRGKTEQERLRGEIRRRTKARGSKNGSAHHHHSHHHHHNHQQQQHKESNGRPVMAHPLHAALGSGAHQVRSILLDTSDTAIHALGMIENRVVLANIEQLECMDVPSGTSLWVCALLANRFVTSLDMHLHTFDVLVSCSKTPYDQEASASSSSARAGAGGGAVAPTISPLMLLQHSENNVEICDANSPMLVQSPSCTAIWDSGAHNRLLFIALSSNRQEHQLVLVSGGSIDSWKVACKTKIPTRGGSASSNSNSCSETKLSQSPGGLYTLVASSRGIRLYQTESLQLLHVYGDQLALHGQSVLWKDCWLAGSYFYETNNRNTNTNTNRSTRKSTNRSTNTNNTTHNFTRAARGLPKEWLQCDDLLLAGAGAGAGETTTIGAAAEPAAEPAAVVGDTTSDGAVDGNDHDHGGDDDHEIATRGDPKNINHHNINYHNRNYNHRTVPDLPPYIIGVPHTKGPKELCENLHVWKVEQPSVVPTITIPLPPKSDGALGLVGAGNGIANQSSIGSGGSSGGSGGSGNHQTGVAKDRIVLVTNNGKGHLLLPQMESNFAGIMYPPGYRVVTNNVEYIEGEDALDHVVPAVEDEHEAEHEAEHEHETDEQEKEHEEEHEDVDILGHSDDEHDNVDVDIDDDDDDDLRKAIQQSLLELKKDEIAREAMKHDTYVDILVPENEPEREYLPCRPEPYLRQMINTEIEDDEGTVTTDDDEEENDGTTGTATGTTTATGAKSERRSNSNNGHPSKASGKEQKATAGAASSSSSSSHRRTNEVFVSHVLDLMPNMQKPKPLEEDCMSFTTTKVVVAVNPVLPARPGRGRKSRAANLETMLKASINPYLQSMMVSKQGVPGSGKGSKLWAGPISALDNRHHGCRRAIGSADAGVSTGALSSSANGSHSHSYAYAYTANNTLTVDTNAGPTLQHRSSSPMEVQNDDEADVVMGLLGLSPCHVAAAAAANNSNSNIVPSNGFVVSGSNQFDTRVGVGMGGVVAGAAGATGAGAASSHVYSKGATYLGPSSLALFNAANANANASNEHIQAFTTSSSVFSSDRDSPVEGMTPTSMSAGANANASNNNNNNNVQPNHQPQPNNSVVDRSCSACRGRLVIHSCGRRSLPIDYEEIARAEREKKEKEEEEKKRLRAEKRRLADQRRREAKKQKQRELEEKRQREELEEQERLQVEERRRLQADFASQDLDRQRRDLIVASYANHVSNNGAGLQTEEEGEGLAQTIAVHSSHVVAHPNNYDNENDSHNGLHQLTSTVLHNGSSFGPFSRVQANGSGSIFEQAAQLPSSNRDVKGKGNYQTKIAAHSNQTGTYSGTHSDHCNQSNPPAASSGITTTSSNKQVAYSRPVPSSLVQDASTSEIDALLGLANLADRKTTEPSGVVAAAAATAAAPSGPEWSNYASASASHGFDDETVSGSVSGEARRGGIPSYAALRGHVHAHAHAQYTDETATTGPATATARSMTTNMATATATAANSFVNGYRHHQTGESQSYAWSARPEG